MADIRTAPESPSITRRADYRAPDWLVPEIALKFELDPAQTQVTALLNVERNGDHDRPLVLDGDGLSPLSVKVDGTDCDWHMDGGALVIQLSGTAHRVETVVRTVPENNTQLMGLYASGGLLCTQCEAEGFRRITFFPDRPDVLSRYAVRMEADKARFPVLLANGDLVGSGDLGGDRHWAQWNDPFPKPSYLFAVVAGDLKANRDTFTTLSGKVVDLAIWVAEADLPKTGHAMDALKTSMKWDEEAVSS